jgi:hypothetical protein
MKLDLDALLGPIDLDSLLGSPIGVPGESCSPFPLIRVGIPYFTKSADNVIFRTAVALGAPLLVSTGALYRADRGGGGLQPWPLQIWKRSIALDSGGFTAMLQGGYRWTPEEYVEWIITNGGGDSETSGMPFPFSWWAAMDYCCEQEIASNREEVLRRIDLTVETYGRCFYAWMGSILECETTCDVPEPMPVIQGRRPEDYVVCARRIGEERMRILNESMPRRPNMTWGDELANEFSIMEGEGSRPFPDLVGVGSVCRREVLGPEGILPVVAALDAVLPAYVKLHLFGVKGSTLSHLGPYMHRVASIDSMAWDKTASNEAKELTKRGAPIPKGEKTHYNLKFRAAHLKRWYERQRSRLAQILKQKL